MQFKEAFVVTHIAYRTNPPYEPLEGPYSSVCTVLKQMNLKVFTLQIPLFDFSVPARYGLWKKEKVVAVPSFLGIFTPVKYVIDIVITLVISIHFFRKHPTKKILVVGIDPLSCCVLCLLKPLFGYTVIFYSVDFNGGRFNNRVLKLLYEKADEYCSKQADHVWAVCEVLQAYKKKQYGTHAFYIPNSNIFDAVPFKKGLNKRTGNKVAWTGSCITNRQFTILFSVVQKIQKIRPDLEFNFAPVGNHEAFKKNCTKYGLKKWIVHHLHSRLEWQQFAATCDVGIAIYDDKFGSTRFIEPLKIWDFMMCGVPFIISSEPSLSSVVEASGVAHILAPHNKIANKKTLELFLSQQNLKKMQPKCITLAKEFAIDKQIKKSIKQL